MKPLNRHILIQLPDKKEEKQQGFYLPEDVVVKKKPHEVVKVLKIASDSKFDGVLKPGDMIVVDSHLITEVETDVKKYYLVLENNVLAVC